jgi:hypothetical protein
MVSTEDIIPLNLTYRKHFTDTVNSFLAHLHHPTTDPFPTRKFHRGGWVACIGHELDELLLLDLVKRLVAGHNPFSEQAFEFCLIPRTLTPRIS